MGRTSDGGGLKYLLLTDIAGSSSLGVDYPGLYPAARAQHDAVLQEIILRHTGEIHQNHGDGFWAVFPSAYSLACAAVEIQQRLQGAESEMQFPDGRCLQVRTVLDCGPLAKRPGIGWDGPAFARAKGLEEMAHGRQTVLTSHLREFLHGHLPKTATLHELGRYWVKGVPGLTPVWQLNHPSFSQQDFPPLKNPHEHPHNLPHATTPLLGRGQEIAHLHALLVEAVPRQRLVTLRSPGGYGKTRLAIEFGWSALAHYPDGVWLVRLEALELGPNVTQEQAQERIAAAALDAMRIETDTRKQAVTRLCDALRDKELLLVFDNLEHVLLGAGVLARLLAECGGLQVLATSREALLLKGELPFPLLPLPTGQGSPSTQLFTQLARARQPELASNEQAATNIERICEELEGVPLAIELVAARADTATLDEMLRDLRDLLNEDGGQRDENGHRGSLRASNDWSWGLLKPEEQMMLQQLSVFRGGWLMEDAAQVLFLANISARLSLTTLYQRGWLRTETVKLDAGKATRFAFANRDLLSYARGRLASEGRPGFAVNARRAHLEYFAGEAWRAMQGIQEAQQRAGLLWFRAQEENVAAAFETALALENLELLDKVEQAYGSYLFRKGNRQTGIELHQLALQFKRARGEERAVSRSLRWLGMNYAVGGPYEEAKRVLRESLGISLRLADCVEITNTLPIWILLHAGTEEFETIVPKIFPLVELCGHESPELAASLLSGIGDGYQIEGRHAQALQCFRESIGLYRTKFNTLAVAGVKRNVASVLSATGDIAAAIEELEQALELYPARGCEKDRALATLELAKLHTRRGNLAQATQLCEQAYAVCQEIHEEGNAVGALFLLSVRHAVAGDVETARDYAQKALAAQGGGDDQEETREVQTWAEILQSPEKTTAFAQRFAPLLFD